MIRPFASQSARDRTVEFSDLVQRLQRDQGAASSSRPADGDVNFAARGPPRASTSGQSQLQSAFARKAGDIGQGIHSTSQKLAKLSQLAKAPPGPFDDNAQAIAGLSAAVKQDIQQLNAAIADLQNLSVTAPENGRQSGKHSSTVVGSLRSRLKDATQEFKNVLTVRQENLKTHQGRRQLFSALPDRPKAPGSRGAQGEAGPSRVNDGGSLFPSSAWKAPSQTAGAPTQEISAEKQPLMGPQQQQSQELMAPRQDDYLTSRAEALHNVEATISELGGIFQQLATMVQEQGELAIRIDENVDDTLANVDSAQAQLLKYLNSISSNRWLIMKVFFVLMLFLVVFLVFVA